jgi:putative hydrolase of the HAD superfamily
MKAIFFDLDNTFYDVRQYYFGAFKEISNYLSKKYRIPKEKIYKILKKLWKKNTSLYPNLFDDLLNIFGLKKELKNVIKLFNSYEGKLKPYPDVITILKELKKRQYKLGIITDGNVKRQERKIKLLGIKKFLKIIIYTKNIKPKPSEKPFLIAIKKLKVNPQNIFYVADNPLIDFEGAKKIGMKTIRLKRGEFTKMPRNKYIDFEIKKFKGLLRIIN